MIAIKVIKKNSYSRYFSFTILLRTFLNTTLEGIAASNLNKLPSSDGHHVGIVHDRELQNKK
jgi:hypothetical protein